MIRQIIGALQSDQRPGSRLVLRCGQPTGCCDWQTKKRPKTDKTKTSHDHTDTHSTLESTRRPHPTTQYNTYRPPKGPVPSLEPKGCTTQRYPQRCLLQRACCSFAAVRLPTQIVRASRLYLEFARQTKLEFVLLMLVAPSF